MNKLLLLGTACNEWSLPIITNSVVLPYQNSEKQNALFVKSLPPTLYRGIYNGGDRVPFPICKKLIILYQMCNHVGFHILHKLQNTSDQVFQPVGEIPCVFVVWMVVSPSWQQVS